MLPVHPQPKEDELLSSWMVRLAFSNGYFLHSFYSTLLGYKLPLWNVDLDRHQPDGLLEVLAINTGQALERLKQLTLSDYQGYLFDSMTVNGNSRWILPLGIYHRQRQRAGLQFCPECLSEDTFYRKRWRLALFSMCEKHRCLLFDRCPECKASVSFHRNGIGKRGLSFPIDGIENCYNCHTDLSGVEPVYFETTERSIINKYISIIRDFIVELWGIDNNVIPCAPLFYSGLHFIASAILGHRGKLARKKIKDELGLDLSYVDRKRGMSLEYLPAPERLHCLLAVSWLIEEWPQRFIEFCESTGISRSAFSDNILNSPFWLSKVIDTGLDHRVYIPTTEEMINAGKYIEENNFPLTKKTFSTVLGTSKTAASAAYQAYKASAIHRDNN
ncbi:TniQ family protein [Microbulbifer litoralis]|uniref:TniQ family protein n=1 Tax=Microbulbifer litoralis TaxID=2933965 RepID=UPI0031F32683